MITGFKTLSSIVSLVLLSTLLSGCLSEPPPQDCPKSVEGDLSLHDVNSVSDSVWPNWGGGLDNRHHAVNETKITPQNVKNLTLKWQFDTSGSVSTNPTIDEDNIYFPDWGPGSGGQLSIPAYPGGKLYAVNKLTGEQVWSKSIRDYNDNDFNNISRSSPAIAGDLLVIGDVQNAVPIMAFGNNFLSRKGRAAAGVDDPCGGYVYAVTKDAGELVWKTRLSDHTYDQVSQSPTVYKDDDGSATVFVGLSSQESSYAKNSGLSCCEFKGLFTALDLHTGKIKWQTPMIQEDDGLLSGASVWAGAPTVDPVRNSVYVPTGNNYEVPDSYKRCVLNAGEDQSAIKACSAIWDKNYFDAIVSLDMDDGSVKWVMKSRDYDVWNAACDREVLIPLLPGSDKNCPTPKGPDADFAQPPMLVEFEQDGERVQRLFAGTKGGEFFSVNPDTGEIVWRRQVGPGGPLGGMQFGAASDGERIYVQNTNFLHEPHVLTTGLRRGETIKGGYWAALDPKDGSLIWETPVPTVDLPFESRCQLSLVLRWGPYVCLHPVQGLNKGPAYWSFPVGPLTVANGLVFAGVSDLDGTMVAMDASSGAILWEYQAGASIASAPSIADGLVYWGTGYKFGKEGKKLLTFGLPD